jgi:hypothetical protein
MIYTGETPPPVAEAHLLRKPIRMLAKSPREKLDEMSRIQYAKYYTVEHNLRVLIIGKIDEKHERRFLTSLGEVQDLMIGMNPPDEDEEEAGE